MAREMKQSGVEWIGALPFDWKLCRMKSCIASRESGAWGDEPSGESGDVICLRIADFDYGRFRFNNAPESELTKRYYTQDVINRLTLHKGDILIEKSGGGEKTPVGRTVIFDKDFTALYANFMDRLRCTDSVDPCFLQYVFVTFYKNEYSRNYIKQTTGIQNLDLTSMLASELIPLPSISEQRRIVEFLDRKCAEIDSVIANTTKTIDEYKTLKQAIITEAVTRGVRGKREMKDSGIPWIGLIPSDWGVSLLKFSIRWKSEKGAPDEQVLSLYRDYGVIPKDSRDDNHNVTSLDTSGYKVVDIGDFVINKMKAWQGSMGVSKYRGIISPAYHVCTITNPLINGEYFHYLMRNQLYIPEYLRLSTGMRVGQWDLGFDDFKNLPFILPNKEEQSEIVSYIETKANEIDSLIQAKEQLLTELETFKKSVIYEYVTGKKEVI